MLVPQLLGMVEIMDMKTWDDFSVPRFFRKPPYGGFHCHGGSQIIWMVYKENPIKMDDLGVPLFQESSIWQTSTSKCYLLGSQTMSKYHAAHCTHCTVVGAHQFGTVWTEATTSHSRTHTHTHWWLVKYVCLLVELNARFLVVQSFLDNSKQRTDKKWSRCCNSEIRFKAAQEQWEWYRTL